MALRPEPDQRPDATVLRRHLAALLGAGEPLALLAPDGVGVADELGLVIWCERHWSEASRWLYAGLPGQVARWRGPALADELRAVVRRHADRATGLDAALALLDPLGYGAARPQLSASARLIELAPQASVSGGASLTFANRGRRHIEARLALPSWLAASRTELILAPGQHAVVTLSADARQVARHGRLRSAIQVESATATLLRVEVRATASQQTLVTRRLIRVGMYTILVSLLALLVSGIWQFWPGQ
jgi:hypothetical protein